MRLIYLASPYNHPSESVRIWRYEAALEVVAKMMLNYDAMVFSPIVHNHPITCKRKVSEHDFWLPRDICILRRTDELRVLKLQGWQKSVGVSLEIEVAELINLDIEYIDPQAWGIKDLPI